MRLNQRQGDAAQRAILEWVDLPQAAEAPVEGAPAAEAEKPAEAKPEVKAGEKKAEDKK